MQLRRPRRRDTVLGATALTAAAALTGCAFAPAGAPFAPLSPFSSTSPARFRTGDALPPPPGPAHRATPQRPNVLMITADDAAPGDLRYMPHTRHLLADRGVTFTDAVAPTPICVPARASLLTGQYTHNHHAYTIDGRGGGFRSFDAHRTLPTWLRAAGYDTLFLGKYLNGYGDTPATAGDIDPGWRQWQALVGGSTYNFTHPTLNINGRLVHYDRYSTDLLSDRSTDLLRSPERRKRPWFMWVNYVAPHFGGPVQPGDPQRLHPHRPDAWVKTTVPAPQDRGRFRGLDLPRTPDLFRAGAHSPSSGPPMSPLKQRMVRLGYQQRVEALQSVDRAVARTVATLRGTGQLRSTVVLFSSDNGWSSGEHNLNGKLWEFDSIERIPLVMAGPGVPRHRRVATAVTNPDLATTIAAIAHARPTRPQDGVDIRPWLRRGYATRIVPVEAYPVHGGTTPLYTGIREGAWTYIHLRRGRGAEELYDRAADPYEMRNLAVDPAYHAQLARFRALDAKYRHCAGASCPKRFTLHRRR